MRGELKIGISDVVLNAALASTLLIPAGGHQQFIADSLVPILRQIPGAIDVQSFRVPDFTGSQHLEES
jgi:hypothetical protein